MAFASRLPDLALSVVARWLVYSVGARLLSSRAAALLALTLYAVGPAFSLVYASRASGAYNVALVLGLLTLRSSLNRTHAQQRTLWLGVLTGAGLWCSPVSVFLTGPALLRELPTLRAEPRRCLRLVLGGVLGASPALVWSVAHDRLGGRPSEPARRGLLSAIPMRQPKPIRVHGKGTSFVSWLGTRGVSTVALRRTRNESPMKPSAHRRLALLAAGLAAASGTLVATTAPAQGATPVRIVKIWYNSPGPDTRSNASLNAEYVVLKNVTSRTRTITGWSVRDAAGHRYTFGTLRIGPGKVVVLHTGRGINTSSNRYWQSRSYIWNNDRDTAYLRDARGALLQKCSYNSTRVAYKIC